MWITYTICMIKRVAVRGIALQNGHLLCARLKDYRHAGQPDFWCTPGGGLDSGEALVPALEREIIEETGIKPKVGNLVYIQQFTYEQTEQLEFFFLITNPVDFQNVDVSKSSHGAVEIAELAFINPREHRVLPKFLTTESFENIASQPVKIFSYL